MIWRYYQIHPRRWGILGRRAQLFSPIIKASSCHKAYYSNISQVGPPTLKLSNLQKADLEWNRSKLRQAVFHFKIRTLYVLRHTADPLISTFSSPHNHWSTSTTRTLCLSPTGTQIMAEPEATSKAESKVCYLLLLKTSITRIQKLTPASRWLTRTRLGPVLILQTL